MPPERNELKTFAIGQFTKIKTGEISSFPSEDELAQQFGYKPHSIKRVLASVGITKEAIKNEHVELLHHPSTELAWTLGVISGNGFIGKGYDIRIRLTRSDEPELLRKFQAVGRRLFGKEPRVKLNSVSFFGKQITSALGNLRNNSWTETISLKYGWILNDPIYTWKFIEGLFDAKGILQTKPESDENRLYFTTNNLTSADFIKNLLLSVGIKNPTVHSKNQSSEASVYTLYTVGVYNIMDLRVIADNIEPKSIKKQNKLQAIKEMPDPVTAITEAEVLSTIAKKSSLITAQIGEDERAIWQYAVHHNLLPKIIQVGIITKQELDSIKDYFENRRRIGQNLTMKIFDKFTIAVAKVA